MIHFVELLAERENIFVSDSTVSKILNDFNILSPKAHKETKRKLKKKLENEKLQGKSKSLSMEIQLSIDLLDRNDAHPRRPRVANFGELIQMDASEHIWFGTIKTHLHLAIDDATGMIVGAYFALQETLEIGRAHV